MHLLPERGPPFCGSAYSSSDFTSGVKGIRTHRFKLFRVGWSSARKTHALEFFFDFLKRALFRQAGRLIETPPM